MATLAPPPSTPATITITEPDPSPTNRDNHLFTVTISSITTHNPYTISTTVTSSPSLLLSWLSSSSSSSLLGLDIEWRPSSSPYLHHPSATLQLTTLGPTTTTHSCLIFQLLYAPLPIQELTDFLAGPHRTFVGVGIRADAERLVEDHGLVVGTAVDVAELAAERGLVRTGAGLREVAMAVVGVEVEKPKRVTMSRWDCEWLSYDQIKYAAVDAFLSFEIGRKLGLVTEEGS